jgi:hypothetical protein
MSSAMIRPPASLFGSPASTTHPSCISCSEMDRELATLAQVDPVHAAGFAASETSYA